MLLSSRADFATSHVQYIFLLGYPCRLKLKCIVSVIPEYPTQDLNDFCKGGGYTQPILHEWFHLEKDADGNSLTYVRPVACCASDAQEKSHSRRRVLAIRQACARA